MAVYQKIGANIRNGMASIQPPPGGVAVQTIFLDDDRVQRLSALPGSGTLDARYKTGGATGWERPGSNLT